MRSEIDFFAKLSLFCFPLASFASFGGNWRLFFGLPARGTPNSVCLVAVFVYPFFIFRTVDINTQGGWGERG